MSENKTHKTNNEKLKEISPFVASLKRNNPFQVPENYFEELPDKIKARLEKNKTNTKSGIKSRPIKPLFYITTAAASILIFLSVWFFTNREKEMPVSFTDITFETLMNESPELIEYIDENTLIDALFVYSTEAIEFSDVSLDSDSSLTNEDIFEYLDNDEEISSELLYNL